MQVEIDRALYMDEAKIEPNASFEAVAELLARVIGEIASIGFREMPLAAE